MPTATAERTLHEDVVAALGELAEIVAAGEADAGQYRYKYAPLSQIMTAVRPVLAKHRLAVSQLVSSAGGDLVVGTSLVHTSGQTFQSGVLVVRQPTTPQQLGSMISYLRRYQLVALLGLAIEDDDASSAQTSQPPAGGNRRTSERVVRPPRAQPPRAQRDDAPSREQNVLIQTLCGELGFGGAARREAKLALVGDILGRTIETTNDVTRAEASQIIDELQRRVERLHEAEQPTDDYDEEGYQ